MKLVKVWTPVEWRKQKKIEAIDKGVTLSELLNQEVENKENEKKKNKNFRFGF